MNQEHEIVALVCAAKEDRDAADYLIDKYLPFIRSERIKYLVMECRRGYGVVLDQEGRFLKIVNLGYEVGSELDTVIEFGENASVRQQGNRKYRALFSAAACLCLILLTSWQVCFHSDNILRQYSF